MRNLVTVVNFQGGYVHFLLLICRNTTRGEKQKLQILNSRVDLTKRWLFSEKWIPHTIFLDSNKKNLVSKHNNHYELNLFLNKCCWWTELNDYFSTETQATFLKLIKKRISRLAPVSVLDWQCHSFSPRNQRIRNNAITLRTLQRTILTILTLDLPIREMLSTYDHHLTFVSRQIVNFSPQSDEAHAPKASHRTKNMKSGYIHNSMRLSGNSTQNSGWKFCAKAFKDPLSLVLHSTQVGNQPNPINFFVEKKRGHFRARIFCYFWPFSAITLQISGGNYTKFLCPPPDARTLSFCAHLCIYTPGGKIHRKKEKEQLTKKCTANILWDLIAWFTGLREVAQLAIQHPLELQRDQRLSKFERNCWHPPTLAQLLTEKFPILRIARFLAKLLAIVVFLRPRSVSQKFIIMLTQFNPEMEFCESVVI